MLQKWTTRIITFLLWALTAGSATFWVLQAVNAAPSAAASKQGDAANGMAASQLPAKQTASFDLTPQVARALGAKSAVAPNPASELAANQARFQLVGVLAAGQRGVALIAIDGQPAKPIRIGAQIEGELQLLSVSKRSVMIGSAEQPQSGFELTLPVQASAPPTLQTPPMPVAAFTPKVTMPAPNPQEHTQQLGQPKQFEPQRPQ